MNFKNFNNQNNSTMKKLFTTLLLLMVFAMVAQAQMTGSVGGNSSNENTKEKKKNPNEPLLVLYFNGAFPMGDFKAGDVTNNFPQGWALLDEKGHKGFAGPGFAFGLEALSPLKVKGLSFFFGWDIIYNSYSSELRSFISDNSDKIDHKPRVMNIALMMGLRYTIDLSNGFGLFFEGGAGGNMRMISNLGYTIKENNYRLTRTISYDLAFTFAFKIGVGMMFGKHVSLGLDYYGLGSADVKGSIKTTEWSSYDGTHKSTSKYKGKSMTCSDLMLRLGFYF